MTMYLYELKSHVATKTIFHFLGWWLVGRLTSHYSTKISYIGDNPFSAGGYYLSAS